MTGLEFYNYSNRVAELKKGHQLFRTKLIVAPHCSAPYLIPGSAAASDISELPDLLLCDG